MLHTAIDVGIAGGALAEAAEFVRTTRAPLRRRGDRRLRFGIRLHVITRDTADQAWAEARRLLAALAPAVIEKVQQGLKRSESEGRRRMLELHGGAGRALRLRAAGKYSI